MRLLMISLVASTVLCAQYPISANALRWDGVTSSAGPFCWGFSCVPEVATVIPGETGTLLVRAEINQSYILAVSLSATRCVTVPGVYNSLVLDDPIILWQQGVCGLGSPILSCPSGTDTLSLTVPLGTPPGTTISIQGLTTTFAVPGQPLGSFTQPLTLQVL